MKEYNKSIIPYIESRVSQMTPLEQKIAQYFIEKRSPTTDFSAQAVSNTLYVSKPTLTRFAKRCGFSGYREFIYEYQTSLTKQEDIPSDFATNVLNSYQELLNKTYSIIDEEKIIRIAKLLASQKRVYIYGKGSSGIVAEETKFRFMRLGLVCEAITDNHIMQMNQVILDDDCLVIGLSISGHTREVMDSLRVAKTKGAKTVLFTANQGMETLQYCDEIQLFAVKDNLSKGNIISPQFPVLIIIDLVYAFFMETNRNYRENIWQDSFQALNIKED